MADLKKVLLDYKPNKIFVSHPADVNGDHWAYYCFMQVALRDLRKELPEPRIYTYFVHTPGWPSPRHYHPGLSLEPSAKDFPDALVKWSSLELTPDEIDKKYKAMLCYRSQTCVSAFYLLSFVRKNELFGDYPPVILKKQSSSAIKEGEVFKDDKRVSYAVVDDCLWMRVRKPPELRYRLFFTFYISGYNDNVAFGKMPNVRVRTRKDRIIGIDELNTRKPLDLTGSSAQLKQDFLILKIPLKTLGDPDFILTCVVTDKPFLPLDASGFRRIEILNDDTVAR